MIDLTNELPTGKADVDPYRAAGFKIKAGPVRGELRFDMPAADDSPEAIAISLLIVAFDACLPAAMIAGFGWLLGAPAMTVLAMAAGLFVAVFATCAILFVWLSKFSRTTRRRRRARKNRNESHRYLLPHWHRVAANGHAGAAVAVEPGKTAANGHEEIEKSSAGQDTLQSA